jgi:hypothetical protein
MHTLLKKHLLLGLMLGVLSCGISHLLYAQNRAKDVKLGAYYFDGWTGKTMHIKKKMVDSFPERKPIWGWETSKAHLMTTQIDLASKAGISFFSFCWYFGKNKDTGVVHADLKNNALDLYLNASNRKKLGFNLLVANHAGYIFKASDWEDLCIYWISLFKQPGYVMVDQQPLITFFSISALKQTFGNAQNINQAFIQFKSMAQKEGLKGVTIAVSVSNTESIELAKASGVDILTGYNYHNDGLRNIKNLEVLPIDSMQVKEVALWNHLANQSDIPYIPAVTLNWDQRPWDKEDVKKSPRFSGFNGKSVTQSIFNSRKWIKANPKKTTKEKIVLLYAWNEYGEGAWLTPSISMGNQLLMGVKNGIKRSLK